MNGNAQSTQGYPQPPYGDQRYPQPGYSAADYSNTMPISPTTNHPHQSLMRESDDELTEEERIEYEKGIISWSKIRNWRYWFRREWLWWYILLVVIVVVVALMVFFHHDIVNWLTPFTRRMQSIKDGWLIPVAIIFALSFPPLFGNEIVMILVGDNPGVFKYWCRGRALRESKKNLNYACLSQALQEGGFVMATIVRLSVIPTHITTVVLSVCGLAFYHFFIALILGLPKQVIAVYVGVVLGRTSGTNSHVVSDCVFAATAVISLGAVWFIYKKMMAVRKKVIIGMRNDLRAKNVPTSAPPSGSGFAQADPDKRSWKNPFARQAVTEATA
ncbi:MAG: Tlg2-vesicle protein [Tremellales sp. Tagirdzhanova-0007]|nr:MAG: Tlg2-vesicle protein [Tremellales sp. Tagirdzhanova-0007]